MISFSARDFDMWLDLQHGLLDMCKIVNLLTIRH